MSDENGKLLDHEYDGIRELDNALPAWWIATFVGTVIFGFIYYIHYMSGAGPTSDQELAASMEVIRSVRGSGPQHSEQSLSGLFTAERTAAGKDLFGAKCAACHGAEGGGLIGPNLTDNAWLNGQGSRVDLHRVISEGVTAKGMPAWRDALPEEELLAITSYVYSIKGTNVVGGKPAQGTTVP